MIKELPLFPTIFYETYIEKDICLDIIAEIKSKEEEIKRISEATQPIPIDDYSTDFSVPIKMDLFEKEVVPRLQDYCERSLNMRMEMLGSWISCYTGPFGAHPMHVHVNEYKCAMHYSAILYLSNIGTTDFFSASPITQYTQHSVQSEIGKVVFFPSIIPHQYRPDQWDGNNRYTLPFNVRFHNVS